MRDDDDDLEIETLNLVPETPGLAPHADEPVISADLPEEPVLTARVRALDEERPIDRALDSTAQDADTQLNQLLHVFQEHVTKIAKLVHQIRSQELYHNLGYETFEAYIRSKELRMSRSFIYQLAKVGEVIENAGVDLDSSAASDLQISKLAQIARLPDPDTHRKVLETGLISLKGEDGTMSDVPLNDVPVKKLNAHINEALGKPVRITPAYDPDPEPVFRGGGMPGMQNAAAYETVVAAERPYAEITYSGWHAALDGLAAELRKLDESERQDAIAEARRVLDAITSNAVPF